MTDRIKSNLSHVNTVCCFQLYVASKPPVRKDLGRIASSTQPPHPPAPHPTHLPQAQTTKRAKKRQKMMTPPNTEGQEEAKESAGAKGEAEDQEGPTTMSGAPKTPPSFAKQNPETQTPRFGPHSSLEPGQHIFTISFASSVHIGGSETNTQPSSSQDIAMRARPLFEITTEPLHLPMQRLCGHGDHLELHHNDFAWCCMVLRCGSDNVPSSADKSQTFRRNYAKISTANVLCDAPIGMITNIIGPIPQRISSSPVAVLMLVLVLV